MSFWKKVWNIRKDSNHRNVSLSKCWLFRRISWSIIMSVFRKSFVRVRWFSSKKFLTSVFTFCKCMTVFFKFSSFRWICFVRKMKKIDDCMNFFQDKICQIERFNSMNNTTFVSVIIRRNVILVNLFIVVRSTHNIEWRWRIHLFSSFNVNFEKAFFIEIGFRFIILLTCEWKTNIINCLIWYFWMKVSISFLFFESSSIIKRLKHSCRQMMFS